MRTGTNGDREPISTVFAKTYPYRQVHSTGQGGSSGVKTKRAALYVRVSSNEHDTGAQERVLREYIQRRGWKLQKICRDQEISGSSATLVAESG